MCVYNVQKPLIRQEERFVYKIVRKVGQRFLSKVRVKNRMGQHGYRGFGHIQEYKLGEYVTAFTCTPGFYCYQYLDDAKARCQPKQVVLRVRIPPRTPFRQCRDGFQDALLVETIQPIEVVYAPKN